MSCYKEESCTLWDPTVQRLCPKLKVFKSTCTYNSNIKVKVSKFFSYICTKQKSHIVTWKHEIPNFWHHSVKNNSLETQKGSTVCMTLYNISMIVNCFVRDELTVAATLSLSVMNAWKPAPSTEPAVLQKYNDVNQDLGSQPYLWAYSLYCLCVK